MSQSNSSWKALIQHPTRKGRFSYDFNSKQNLIDGGIYPQGYERDDTSEAGEPGNRVDI